MMLPKLGWQPRKGFKATDHSCGGKALLNVGSFLNSQILSAIMKVYL